MIERHFHWIFYAYNNDQVIDPGLVSARINNMVTITVIGQQNEESAKEAAMEVITRENYFLSQVFECNTCRYFRESSESLRKLTE